MDMKIKTTNDIEIKIYIAGDLEIIKKSCQEYVDDVSWCVTVTPTDYVYRNGNESGVIIGIINYARFPSTREELLEKTENLANKLLIEAGQTSFTIVDGINSTFYSIRDYD